MHRKDSTTNAQNSTMARRWVDFDKALLLSMKCRSFGLISRKIRGERPQMIKSK